MTNGWDGFIAVCVLIGVLGFFASITVPMTINLKEKNALQSECIKAKGQWQSEGSKCDARQR